VLTSIRDQLDILLACSKLREPLNLCWLFQDLEEKTNITKILQINGSWAAKLKTDGAGVWER
jgi:hypothetical protein